MSSQKKAVAITCPVCEAQFEVNKDPGEAAECPRCGQLLEVPGPSALSVGFAQTRKALGEWWMQRKDQQEQRRKEKAEAQENTSREPAPVETEKAVAAPEPEEPPVPESKLFPCPDCGHQVSRNATACPNCGCVLASQPQQPPLSPMPDAPPPPATAAETPLLIARPAMFKKNPLSWALCGVLCLVGIGLILLLREWFRCRYTCLTVTNRRVILRRGYVSHGTSEVRHQDIRNIFVSQGFFDRLFGVGNLAVSSAATDEVEITVAGIKNPSEAAAIIRQHQG